MPIETPTWEDTTEAPPSWDDTQPETPSPPSATALLPPPAQPLPVVTLPTGVEERRMYKEGLEPTFEIPRITPPKETYGVPRQFVEVGTGLYNALAGAAESLTSPASVVTMGAGAAEQASARLAAGIWGAFMAKSIPGQVQEARKAFAEGKPLSEKTEAVLAPIITTALAGTALKGAATPRVEQVLPEAPKAPETPSHIPEPLPRAENAPAGVPQGVVAIPVEPVKAAEAPVPPPEARSAAEPVAEAQAKVSEVARTEGKRSAQEIKDDLVAEIQDRLQKAPSEAVPGDKVTIEIPDDGTFIIPNTVEALSEVLKRAKAIKITQKPPGVPRAAIKASGQAIATMQGEARLQREAAARSAAIEAKAAEVPKPAEPAAAAEVAPEGAIAFPGIGSLREKQATAMELGKIRKSDPGLWKAITQHFGTDKPAQIAKLSRARFEQVKTAGRSAGPGAASPVEFELRQREQQPPGDNPPVAVDAGKAPNADVVRKNKDYQLFNQINSGQFAFWFGRLGEAAKSAWERMALGEFRMRENIGRDVRRYVNGALDTLPRQLRKKGGQAFFDVLNGKRFEDIEAEWEGKPGGGAVLDAVRDVKTRLEEIRTTIRDTKREAYTGYLLGLDRPLLEELFRKNISDKTDIRNYSKESLANALATDQYPGDWGISDGTYLPHLFFGNWKVTLTDAGGETRFITRTKTPQEAKAEIYRFTKNNPELADANFKIEQDATIPADMIRLGDRNFWRMVNEMKEATGLSAGEVKAAQSGIIGRKASKKKWFGSLQHREGFEGYSHDYQQVMSAYLSGFHRWKELSAMQREVQPLIETVRREGRTNAADRLDEIMDNLWGKPAKSTLLFDAFVRQIPVLRDFIKPLALDRWSRNVRAAVAIATLKTLRFAVVNRLQPLQGLYPLVGERILAQAKIAQHTKEGRALLDEAGVRFDPGQYRAESSVGGRLTQLQEKIFGESSNQELAFLAMFQHGTERGLSRADAMNYAKLRGQLLTQFTPLIADTPALMRGPGTGLLFQFKRFPVKQAELLATMVREKNIPGIARFLAVMALAGGASFFLRQTYQNAERKKRLRNTIAEAAGDKVADIVMYGLPGLIGADLSGSLVLGDEPFGANIYEKAGRQVAGPAVSIGIDTATALAQPKREATTLKQDAVTLLRRFPSFRPLAELMSLNDLDVRSPDGEVKYRKSIRDALLGLGAFRSANESNLKLAEDAIFEIESERKSLKNRVFVDTEKGNADSAYKAVYNFNDRWPEFEIRNSEIRKYIDTRRKGASKTDVERIEGKRYRGFIPDQP